MANFRFLKEASLYVVYGSNKYKLDTNEISFSQSFKEKSYEVKTIQEQSSFEGSVINEANPANFSFNVPLLKEVRNKVVVDRLIDCESFDLYISTEQDVLKLQKCVIQDGTFEINKSRPLRLAVSGEASKLSNYTGTIPGTLQNTTVTASTYTMATIDTLTLGGEDVSSDVVSLTVELQNDIDWNKYNTLQGTYSTTSASTSMYPSNYTIGTRMLGGTITKYLKDDAILDWGVDKELTLTLGDNVGGTVTSVAVTSGGGSYSSTPEVTISGGGGTGATATATLSGSAVSGLTITNPGSGYTSNPTLTIAASGWGGSGSTATGTATISSDVVYGIGFNVSKCSYTLRSQDGDVFKSEYNWRMTSQPAALSSVIEYTTY